MSAGVWMERGDMVMFAGVWLEGVGAVVLARVRPVAVLAVLVSVERVWGTTNPLSSNAFNSTCETSLLIMFFI